ncbi:OmcA/MtrC family decaheme c-type cytochrome [Paraferrimonas haliotis]|uniref:Cytochrome c n=2 Tax=Paraferrimonas haliotis TaxID=2013866 RepID=A0AA37WY86_9GAMM|nr:OmcA/MtrC family decaheme c-type cytochrome [Paraferrimonas haliotis]GLS84244.1 cytochrome c [Paraferrimonas haliotis]
MKFHKSELKKLVLASMISAALVGCGSDGKDGDPGEPGEPGRPGGDPATSIEVLNLAIDQVKYEDGQPTIQVYASNEEGKPVVGITGMGMVIAQLTPQGVTSPGDSAEWERTGRVSGADNYVDQKNGYYTFTPDLSAFDEQLTQRFNVYAGGEGKTLADGVTEVPRREIVADYNGQGGAAHYTKDIVSHEACTACHTEGTPLTRRHGSYETNETCATCHNGSFRTETQWKHLVHNIHNTTKSFTDKYGNDYTGEKAEHLLQNNCQSCHVESEELAEWGNWTRVPTMETCSSCHDIDFKAGQGHTQQLDNSNCVACHNPQWTEELHLRKAMNTDAVVKQVGMSVTLEYVADDTNPDTVNIVVSLNDMDGNDIDASSVLNKIKRVETITNVGPNFPVMGYNANPANGIEKKVTIDLVKDGKLDPSATIEDGNIVANTGALPFGAGDTDTAFTFVGLAMCSDADMLVDCAADGTSEYTGMKADLAHVTKSGDAPALRHIDSVNFASCTNCHGDNWQIHKGYHAGFVMTEEQMGREVNGELRVGTDACVTCHTPEGTYAPGNNGAWEMKIHQTHNGEAIIKDCAQCHDSFNTAAFEDKGAIRMANGYTTPRTATCLSCHSADSIGHGLENQGAIVEGDFTQANDAAQSETCFFCHDLSTTDHTRIKM